jgi:hypothetical protein
MLGTGAANITVLHRANNWMQGWEGEMDTVHAAFLHFGAVRAADTKPGSLEYYEAKTRAGRFSVRDTDHGTSYSMIRPAEETPLSPHRPHAFPCFLLPPFPLGGQVTFIAYVPMDGYHALEWNVFARPQGQAPQEQ